MDISEVAKKSGVAASALRYYERKGLIRSLQSEGARRQFSPAVLDQLALIALNHPAHAAAIVLGFGAGIGHVGPYEEQGNIYRGGALQLLFASWFRDYIGSSGPGADQKLAFPTNLSPEDKTRLMKLYSLKLNSYASTGKVSTEDMLKFYDHLPAADIVKVSRIGLPKARVEPAATPSLSAAE